MSSETDPDVKVVGYCRACGKALDESSVHSEEGTIYCAEHAPSAARATATPPVPGSEPGGAPAASTSAASPPPQADYSPYTSSSPPPMPDSDVSPGVAFVLGMIP